MGNAFSTCASDPSDPPGKPASAPPAPPSIAPHAKKKPSAPPAPPSIAPHAGNAASDRAENEKLGAVIGRVYATKSAWANTPPARKAQLLIEMLRIFATCDHEQWAKDSLEAQGYDIVKPETSIAVEMILNTRLIGKDLETLVDVFCTLRDTGAPPVPTMRERASTSSKGGNKAMVADVFPRQFSDFKGPDRDWRVEVWMEGDDAGKQGE
jgi:hypothetical protein